METNQHEDEQSLDGEYDDSEDEEEHEHEQDIQDQEDEDPGVVPDEEEDGDETDEEDAKSGETGSSDNHESARAHTKPKSHSSKQPKDRTVVKTTVTTELTHQRAKQDRRYHSKKGIGKGGRAGGSKWKSDKKVRLGERGGIE
jgi:RIO kinase 2